MRDEEVRKTRNDMSSKRKISPFKNSSTEQFNRKPPDNDAMNYFFDLDDRSSPSIERLSNEEANWQHEDEKFTPPERRLFSRNNGMSFNMAEATSIGESDGESLDSLPLGFWSLQTFFYIFIFYPLQTFCNLPIVDCTFFIAYVWSNIYSSHPNNQHQTCIQNSFQQGLSMQLITCNSWTAKYSIITPWPQQKPTKTNSSLQQKTKQSQREHINKENFWKTCIQLSKFKEKHSRKSGSRLLCIYSLQCLIQNSLNRSVSQPLCDPSDIQKMYKWENQSVDDLLDLGPRPWGISRGVTDQHLTHIH